MPSTALSVQATQSRPHMRAETMLGVDTPPPAPTPNRDAYESLFISCLGTIESIVRALARRHRLSADDAADLCSVCQLRIMADDYAVLRQFQMRSSLRTYLTVVVRRVFLDERTALLGKWRPSRHAVRTGSTAVLLERLTMRDRLTFDEACDVLKINHRLQISRVALEGMYARAHRGPARRFVATDRRLEEIPASTSSPEERVVEAESAALTRRTSATLRRALASIPIPDRRILEVRYARGLSIADVARVMGLNQKALYARFHRLLRMLREYLENDGIVGHEILEIIGGAGSEPVDITDRSWASERIVSGRMSSTGVGEIGVTANAETLDSESGKRQRMTETPVEILRAPFGVATTLCHG